MELFRSWWLRWLNHRLPPSRKTVLNQRRIFILPTAQGLLYLLVTLVVFIGGINYANSLILAVAFLLISLFIVTILHTYANLSGLQISAGRTENGFAGDRAYFEILLSSTLGAGRSFQAIELSWQDELPERVDVVAAQPSHCWLPVWAFHRGYCNTPRVKVETRFPLGLLRAWTLIQLSQQCLIYPEPLERDLPNYAEESDLQSRLTVQGQTDFDGLKSYVAGDNPRRLAWKQYARSGQLTSKQFIDHLSDQRELDWNSLPGLDQEQRLSVLCYWVLKLSREQQPFALRLPGQGIAQSSGDGHRLTCLKALATFNLAAGETAYG